MKLWQRTAPAPLRGTHRSAIQLNEAAPAVQLQPLGGAEPGKERHVARKGVHRAEVVFGADQRVLAEDVHQAARLFRGQILHCRPESRGVELGARLQAAHERAGALRLAFAACDVRRTSPGGKMKGAYSDNMMLQRKARGEGAPHTCLQTSPRESAAVQPQRCISLAW